MEPRLVRLMASFVKVSGDYALARLEFAMRFPKLPAPPVLSRPRELSERGLRACWNQTEAELEQFFRYMKQIEGVAPGRNVPVVRWLRQIAKEMEQYARAMRWVLTVTERAERKNP